MSTQDIEMPAAEADLGKVLALIQRVLPRLDEPARAAEVQAALTKASALLESARQAHAEGGGMLATGPVTGEIVAAIAAAISTVLSGPYRLLSVQPAKVTVPVPHLNVWAVEGRTQIFSSHKVR